MPGQCVQESTSVAVKEFGQEKRSLQFRRRVKVNNVKRRHSHNLALLPVVHKTVRYLLRSLQRG